MTTHADDTARPERARLGAYGEDLACRYLREQGLEVVERNWRCEHGEIDVVARDGPCLVVVEVKTRRGTGFGDPVEAVTVAKALRLRRLAAAYVREHGPHRGPIRLDVVGVLCLPGSPPRLRHVVGVGS
ncbi:YraN family protein [Phycicoccus flavus]|uniref:YraN family protein n=1 Tax=Phycicoccus flavus TaxID=2502783 RepID=UPI000FEB83FB|nr:YraN family protein [Phycicoccus flavus]NHA66978.1 YraN family protein [Phycicoccus flavus]